MEIPGKGSLDLLVADAGDRAGQVRLRRSLDAAAKSPSEQEALEKSAKEFEGVFLNERTLSQYEIDTIVR